MPAPGTGMFVDEVTRSRWVLGAIALCLGSIGAALWVPGLPAVLSLPDPGWRGLALALAAGCCKLGLVLGKIVRWLVLPDRFVRPGMLAHRAGRYVARAA